MKDPLKASILPAIAVLVALANVCFGSSARVTWSDAVVTQVTAVPSGLDIEAQANGATQAFRCRNDSSYFHYCQAVQVGDRLYLVGRPAPDDVDEPYVRLVEMTVDFEATVTPPTPGGGGDQDGD